VRTRAEGPRVSESEGEGVRSGCAMSWSCVLEFEEAAFSWMCARRREDVGERGAKLTDLLCGREGDGGGDELGESVETVEGARG